MVFREQGLYSVKPVCCIGNMDRQESLLQNSDLHLASHGVSQGSQPFPAINPTYWRILQKAQDKQDKKLLHANPGFVSDKNIKRSQPVDIVTT